MQLSNGRKMLPNRSANLAVIAWCFRAITYTMTLVSRQSTDRRHFVANSEPRQG
jgi:hypothetical protein